MTTKAAAPEGTAVWAGESVRDALTSRPWHTFAVLAAISAAALLIYGRGLWFFFDEWRFIFDRHLTIADLIRPHNEHWSAVLVLIYRGLVELVGTGSYLPFHAVLVACHVVAASGVLALLMQVTTRGIALALTVLFLAFGAGSDNLLWAFQIGFVLATGLGTWALALAPRRPAVAAVLLTVAVATQGVGLFFLAATVVRLHRSRSALWLAIPVAVYGAWFLVAGRVGDNPSPVTDQVAFFAYGFLASAGSLVAGGPVIGALFLGLALVAWRRGVLSAWSLAALAGLVVEFGLIALARAHLEPSFAAAPRYLYVGAPFVLVILSEAWRAVSRPSIRTMGPVFLSLAVLLNLAALVHARGQWDQQLAAEASVPPQERGFPD